MLYNSMCQSIICQGCADENYGARMGNGRLSCCITTWPQCPHIIFIAVYIKLLSTVMYVERQSPMARIVSAGRPTL